MAGNLLSKSQPIWFIHSPIILNSLWNLAGNRHQLDPEGRVPTPMQVQDAEDPSHAVCGIGVGCESAQKWIMVKQNGY